LSLDGQLSVPFLKVALDSIVERHEILRTMFLQAPGMRWPVQEIFEDGGPVWREVDLCALDLCGMDPSERETNLARLFEAEAARPHDLEHGSILHATLFKLASEKHALFISLPAMCADAGSLRNLVCEIASNYAACLKDEEIDAEPMQYIQFSEWQNELLDNEESAAGRDFWREQRMIPTLPLYLPFEKRGDDGNDGDASCVATGSFALTLDAGVADSIKLMAARHGVSTQVSLLACWQTLLWRLSEETDVSCGCVFDGRKYEELNDALGLYARRLPLLCHFDEGARFAEILRSVGKAHVKAGEWQEYFNTAPEEDLNSILSPRLFGEVAFEFEERVDKFEIAEIEFSLLEQKSCAPACKLQLSCVQTTEGLTTEFTYDPVRFDGDDIERLAMQFHKLLASAASNPEALLANLDFLSDAEREQLVFAFNRTATAYPQDTCVHELFEAQVERTPHNVAVVFGTEQATYAELNARANQLAHYLRESGVAAETLVGICLERSIEMIVGILGVLKAGGAYVPLDPHYPRERLQFMMQDIDARVLLTQTHLLPNLPEHGATLICLDGERDKIEAASAANPSRATFSDNLVYVIFTSGSTGRPKGVMIPHQGVVNYLKWCTKAYAVDDGDGSPVHSPLGFDLTVTSLFTPLIVGKCVTLIAEEQGIDGLGELLSTQSNFSLVKITPSHLEVIKDRLQPSEMAGRARALVIGGEALPAETLALWRTFAPETRLVNEYGPTETVVGSCIYEVQPECPATGVVPIGRPIANTQLYLLDEEWQLAPLGVSGELYIGGDGVARGYLRRPGLTAERFIPNPFSKREGARLYRTGDVARYLPDSKLEYLGRIDEQVKIRGFRVELGEIEAVLVEHESVRQCVVMAREDLPGDKRLVAYIVSGAGEQLKNAELRQFLHERLPDYMVPSAFVQLDALPHSTNGKIDRRALPRPERAGLAREQEYVAPRTVVEEVLSGIWAEVLGVERVGVRDNFFELGGHSLLATQVVSRLRSAFAVEVALRSLFDRPTVAGLAEVVEAARGAGEGLQTPPMQHASRDGVLPVSFAQRRLWFFHKSKPESMENVLTLGIRVAGQLNVEALRQALNEIVRRHEVLRMSFDEHEGEPVQIITAAHDFALPFIDLCELSEAQREEEALLLFAREESRRFDLKSSPLMRALLLGMEAESHVLLLTLHHIASDGWSHSILLREMAVLYRAFSAGERSPLEELPIQYADYASWQRNWLQGPALEEQLDYWKRQLLGAPMFLELPTDHTRPSGDGYGQEFPAAIQNFALAEDLSKQIKALSRREGMSLFMTLLGAYQALLARYAGQYDIAVGTPIAGRNRAETENLIGMFVNQLTLRTDLSGNPTFRELLRRVRTVTFDAYAHQELPFNQVVEVLNPEAGGGFKLPFQVKFRVENTPDETPQEALALANLSLNYFVPRGKPMTMKLDHILSMREQGDCITGQWMYNAALFERSSIERLIEDFQTLLRNAVANPETPLLELLPVPQPEPQPELCVIA
jgi:amino acid adenylation domain-containing protein